MGLTSPCPLCTHDVPASELSDHAPFEDPVEQDDVLHAMLEANPDWVVEDGACPRCWEEYAVH